MSSFCDNDNLCWKFKEKVSRVEYKWIKYLIIVAVFLPRHGFVGAIHLDLPPDHLPFYFSSDPELTKECAQDPECPYKAHLGKQVCWGFEERCELGRAYSLPVCDEDHKGWVKTKSQQVDTFYEQADFGYVKRYRNSMQLICAPKLLEDSALECSELMTFCRGRNIMIDFRRLVNRTKPVMYDMDVLSKGEVGGHCTLNRDLLRKQSTQISALQTWAPEFQHFEEVDKPVLSKESKMCDQIIRTPTFVMKIDATVNMYHHFCDFFNLYASLFVNSTKKYPDLFTKNVRIVIWRSGKYSSNFEAVFRAFSAYPIMTLDDFKGKRVCFKNAVFPLLPRMIFGLYYNTPLIWGCRNSGLFHAFSKFILHRLRIPQRKIPADGKIKVTFLSRFTKYRKVVNEDELVNRLKNNSDLIVNKVVFTWQTDFVDQLTQIQDSDILIGMHGAGLTHLMFLPDWAVVFELFNCGDIHCYSDLARLRGVKYLTWRKKDLIKVEGDGKEDGFGPDHEKHKNYSFDVDEFSNLLNEATNHVRQNWESHHQTDHDEL